MLIITLMLLPPLSQRSGFIPKHVDVPMEEEVWQFATEQPAKRLF
ncbi:MAG TPA: hypothetical protein VII35_00775 [Steroidobacteraceae bacterium]